MANPKYPRNPSRILTTAYKMGIAITLALAKDRATGIARPLYFGKGKRIVGMARIWRRAKESYRHTVENMLPDASLLLKVEHAIRRSFSRILLKTSVRYGNTETKRVKREEGKKGYLNSLWDYAGSRIRDAVKPRYIFPKPVIIEMDDGSKVYGYSGSSHMPFYPVRHNHLPELDFGDMIRSPLMELARQCLKYGVSLKDAKRYLDALLFRLIPYMDYVYTERRSGKPNYVRNGLKEIRVVANQIEAEYGTRNGQRQSITAEVRESVPFEDTLEEEMVLPESNIGDELHKDEFSAVPDEVKTNLITSAIDEAISAGAVPDKLLSSVNALIDSAVLTKEDSLHLIERAREQSRRIGNQFHNFVAMNFQSPFSFKSILFHGKEMAYDDSGLMLFSEVSVDNGRGRVDLMLVQAKELTRIDESPAPIYCEPLLIADLKTKSAFNFDIYGIESRSGDANNIVNEFILERRSLTDKEWKAVLSNTPDEYAKRQLDTYEAAVTTAYRSMRTDDPDAPDNLTKAVIVVDSLQDWKTVSEALFPLILKAYQGCVNGSLSEGDFILPSTDDASLKIAMKLISIAQPNKSPTSLNPPVPLESFTMEVQDDKEFNLYLTAVGKGSPSQSAAVIAERWHGLQYLHGLAHRRHRAIVWFDLVGEYTDPILRKKQFRLRYQSESIRRFFKRRVRMKDFSNYIQECILEGTSLNLLRSHIESFLREKHYPIIVVSGWEKLRRSTPVSKNEYLDEIAATIMQALPRRCTVLWFARPVPTVQNSITYSTRCVAPFYQHSIWQNLADVIIWNLPMPPSRSGARYPTNDHERAIFVETPGNGLEGKMSEVVPLREWGKDFRSGGRGERTMHLRGIGQTIWQSQEYVDSQLDRALELIPHILSSNEYNPQPRSDTSIAFCNRSPEDYPEQDVHPMLSFNPTQLYAFQPNKEPPYDEHTPRMEADGRVKILLPMSSINKKREYREMGLHVLPTKRTIHPPSDYYLKATDRDGYWIAFRELRQLRDAISFLKGSDVRYLAPLLDELSKIVTMSIKERTSTSMNTLRLVRQTLETHPLSKDIWNRLSSAHSARLQGLTPSQRKHIVSLQMRHPDILMITGNHLFLMLLASLGPFGTISYTDTLRSLWDYIRPWQLIGLGFKVEYPKGHFGRKSVLDRDKLVKQLARRSVGLNRSLDQQANPTRVRFGQLIVLPSSGASDSLYLWMLFQRSSGTSDMNAALLNPRGIDPTLSPVETLGEMASGQTYWSESDLSRLSWYANLQGNERRMPIMLAVQRGIQVLFLKDHANQRWAPVSSIDFRTRKFEDVTLVRTLSLTAVPYLQPVRVDDVRQPMFRIEDMVERTLLILNRGLEGCIRATCKVTLDSDQRMYRADFFHKTSGTDIGELLINRTADLLEILRRPDNMCEPVQVQGKRLIWNRFNDVILDKDVALIQPWVNRRDPFPQMALKLPSTAYELLEAQKEADLTLEIYHDPWTCPLRHISLEMITQSQQQASIVGPRFMIRFMREWAEPSRISNEPGIHHGSCWRLHVHSKHALSPELAELMNIRFTDAQLSAFLRPQELIYWSDKRKEWITHTFAVILRDGCTAELEESWHLRELFNEVAGKSVRLSVPGTYLQNPDRWKPLITIEPDCVTLELREKGLTRGEEHRVPERDVALREASDVKELLNREMDEFLKRVGIRADRRLSAAIQDEIAAAIELSGVQEEKTLVVLDRVAIERDKVGGRVLYVFLVANDETHRIPVTGHLHSLKERGRITNEHFVSEVESILDEFNLSSDDRELATKECLRLMMKESIIKRQR